jgi:hypothetical protein
MLHPHSGPGPWYVEELVALFFKHRHMQPTSDTQYTKYYTMSMAYGAEVDPYCNAITECYPHAQIRVFENCVAYWGYKSEMR